MGIIGAAISVAVAGLTNAIISTYKVRNLIGGKIPFLDYAKVLTAGIVFVALLFIFKKLLFANTILKAFVSAVVAFVVYLSLLIALKTTSIREIKKIIKSVAKRK